METILGAFVRPKADSGTLAVENNGAPAPIPPEHVSADQIEARLTTDLGWSCCTPHVRGPAAAVSSRFGAKRVVAHSDDEDACFRSSFGDADPGRWRAGHRTGPLEHLVF
jgi:hypothetical protein